MTAEPRPTTAPSPVPVSPADRSDVIADALVAAADQLREHAVGARCGSPLPPELALPYDGVTTGALYAVAEWLESRAGLYGWTRPVEVVTFDDAVGAIL